MNLTRKYLQFNDLVIDSFDMLVSADLSSGFKTKGTEYSFGHGSYTPITSRQFSTEQELSMTLKLDTRKLSCEQVEYYKDFVLLNLSKPGRIWVIQGKQLLWAFAYVTDFGEAYTTERYSIEIDVDFVIYEGVWHKADVRKTFFKPYDLCNYLDCLDFHPADQCYDCCVECTKPGHDPCPTCVCECEHLSEEYSLCVMRDEVTKELHGRCGRNYKIIYNCEAGSRIWGSEKMLGQKICKQEVCDGIIAGQFYSDTLLDSSNVTITIVGKLKNPLITINGNALRVLGEYDGTLTIALGGEIYFHTECCEAELVDIENIVIPDGSTFGFLVHHGNNSIVIETHDCCSMACAYIKVDSITI